MAPILKKEFIKSITLTKQIFAFIGVPIYVKYDKITPIRKVINQCLYVFWFCMLVACITTLFTYVLKAPTFNFLDVTNVAPCMCYCIIGLVKLWALQTKLEKAEKLMIELDALFPAEEEDPEIVKIVLANMSQAKLAKYIITITNLIFIWVWNLSSIVNLIIQYIKSGIIVRGLPYYLYIPFDTNGPISYPIAYLYHIGAGVIANIGTIGPDNYFIAIASHICLQFQLLQVKVQGVIEEVTPVEEQDSLDIDHDRHDVMYRKLVKYVHLHRDLIELADIVEDIFTLSILVNFLGSSILICCVGFQSTVVQGVEILIFLLFLAVGLIQTYFLCLAGQKLIENSNGIGDAVYNSSWYITDKKYRRMVHFIILRSQRPQMFTALRFSVVCLRSFSSIMSSSYSYFTLLNTSYKK